MNVLTFNMSYIGSRSHNGSSSLPENVIDLSQQVRIINVYALT